jgi:hypothetical protein
MGLRALRVHDALKPPEALLGLLAALWLSTSSDRRVRAMAVLALVTTFVTGFGAKSLYGHYFLFCLPFWAICLAVLVGNRLATTPQRWPILISILLVIGLQLYEDVNRVRMGKKLHSDYANRLAMVEKIPEKIVLANPLYVVLGHKEFPDDYFSPDTFVPRDQGWFEEWLERVCPKTDAVLIDDEFLGKSPSYRTYEVLRRANKPMYFATPEFRQDWELRAGYTLPPAHEVVSERKGP